MNIAVLGTGIVGNAIATTLVKTGHQVMMGSRTANSDAGQAWLRSVGGTAQCGPAGGKLRYPAISSNALPHMTLDTSVKHWEFFLLCPEPALFAFL